MDKQTWHIGLIMNLGDKNKLKFSVKTISTHNISLYSNIP